MDLLIWLSPAPARAREADDPVKVAAAQVAAPPARALLDGEVATTTITYEYDSLYRLVEANYDDGSYYHYEYDAVGNRLNETTDSGSTTYAYDIANRLTAVNGATYTWDDNGNLLDDGVNDYIYNHANKLIGVDGPEIDATYTYNGLGDRLQQSVGGVTTDFTLDLAAGLTQVLSDETNAYLYGVSRIAQHDAGGVQYFLGDALGSVRQLTDESGEVTLAEAYQPYGETLTSTGYAVTSYGFTSEWRDPTGLIFLRARYYAPIQGRFLTKDSWQGNNTRPISYNNWLYADANPVNLVDPSGHFPVWCQYAPNKALYEACILAYYQLEPISYWSLGSNITGERGCYAGKIDYRAPGYLEGVGGFVGPLLGDYIPSTWGGVETVYDFATMERSSFWYTGPGISDAFLGAGIAQYGGGVAGFRSNANIKADYGGPFWVLQGGISVDFFVGFGAGIGGFVSTSDVLMRGMTWYGGGSISLSDWIEGIDAGGAYLDYKPVEGSRKSYVRENGSIDKVSLLSDIMSGNQSPWPDSYKQTLPRAYFSILALNYVRAYEELRDAK